VVSGGNFGGNRKEDAITWHKVTTMALTDTAIRESKPASKPYKKGDGGGLYIEIRPNGAKWWRLRYRFHGKQKLLSMGVYPHVGLKDARRRRDEAKKLLAEGKDPSTHRQETKEAERRKLEGTFARCAESWLAKRKKDWADETRRKAEYTVHKYLNPALGNRPIADLSSRDVAKVLEQMDEVAPNLAKKARQYVHSIIQHAMRQGLREDGKVLMLDGVLGKGKNDTAHIPAITHPEGVGELLRAINSYESPVIRAALLMCAYTAQRPGIVASMRWDELVLDSREWRIPPAKMKTRHTHIVSLPKQALDLLEAMRPYTAGREYVFPPLARQKTPHLHRDALSKALRSMGFSGRHATHGFRAMLRTLGRERLGIDSEILEAQLAHAKRGEVQAAYDRTAFTEARREAMQQWADWLDKLAEGGKVVPIREGMADAD